MGAGFFLFTCCITKLLWLYIACVWIANIVSKKESTQLGAEKGACMYRSSLGTQHHPHLVFWQHGIASVPVIIVISNSGGPLNMSLDQQLDPYTLKAAQATLPLFLLAIVVPLFPCCLGFHRSLQQASSI